MSVAEMQACLGHLYVDDMFRELFFKEAEVARRWYQLTDAELAALAGIDQKMFAIFVDTLKKKRRKRLAVAYPGLFSLDEREIQRHYLRFYHLYTVHHARSAFDDIQQFGTFMQESLSASASLPAYAAELAKFERLRNAVMLQPSTQEDEPQRNGNAPDQIPELNSRPRLYSGVQASTFHFDIVAIVEQLRAEGHAGDAWMPGEAYGLVFERAGASNEPRVFRLSRAAMMVLNLCDGRRTVAEIIDVMEADLDISGLEQNVLGTIERLAHAHVLRI